MWSTTDGVLVVNVSMVATIRVETEQTHVSYRGNVWTCVDVAMYSISGSQVGELLSNAKRLLGLQPPPGRERLCNYSRVDLNFCTNHKVTTE